ncbi:DNA primase [Streptomyces sp. NPDC002553]|uniref:DNA primase n=1 Tax=Streptomyces sp. NPDC002553 TaxID=3154417 RepID=UPI00331CF7AD
MNRMGLGLAVGAGYLLGRTKKMKLAFAVGSLVAGKRMNLTPKGLADLVSQQLKDNPQFKEIGDQLREDLRGVGKAASGAMVERQMSALADRLHSRTSDVRDQLNGVVPDAPGSRSDDEEEPEDVHEEEPEAAEEEPEAAEEEPEEARAEEDDEEPEEDEEEPEEDEEEPEEARAEDDSDEGEDEDQGEDERPAKKAAKKAPAKKAPAKKTAAAKRTPAKKTAAKKTATARKTASKTASRTRGPKGGGER